MYKIKTFQWEIKEINRDEATLTGVFSTSDVDRHGEIVDQKTWLIEDFLKNPVILWSHDNYEPAIGKALTLYKNADGNLEGVIKFAVNENPKARVIFDLFAGGFIKAFSVGFMSGSSDRNADGVIILRDNTLLEISAVNIPANQMALAKAKGIDCEILKEGRVLSKKNKAIIQNAHEALGELLNADVKEEDKKEDEVKSSDISTFGSKVSRTGDRKNKAITVLNKALRALYKERLIK